MMTRGISFLVVGLMAVGLSAFALAQTSHGSNIKDDAFPNPSDVVTTVGPQMNTRVLMVYDTDSNGFGGVADMNGPRAGFTFYSQTSLGALGLTLTFNYAMPSTTYTVYLTCGPSHALACGFISIGTVTTSSSGTATAGKSVSLATLRSAPFGCGYRTDHIDMIGGTNNSTLTSGAINYFVPCAAGTSPVAPTTPSGQVDPTQK